MGSRLGGMAGMCGVLRSGLGAGMMWALVWLLGASLVVSMVHGWRLSRERDECHDALVHVLDVMRTDPDLTEYMIDQMAKVVDEHGPYGSC